MAALARRVQRSARAADPAARLRQRPAAAAHFLDALGLARHRRREPRRDRRFRAGRYALRVQVPVVAADRSIAAAAAAGAPARLGPHDPDCAGRRDARAGLMRSQARSRHDGRAGAAGRVSLGEPGYRDRRVAGRNPRAGAAGARRRHDPDRLPDSDAGFGRGLADDRRSRWMVRGVRHDGRAPQRRDARVPAGPRAGAAAGAH